MHSCKSSKHSHISDLAYANFAQFATTWCHSQGFILVYRHGGLLENKYDKLIGTRRTAWFAKLPWADTHKSTSICIELNYLLKNIPGWAPQKSWHMCFFNTTQAWCLLVYRDHVVRAIIHQIRLFSGRGFSSRLRQNDCLSMFYEFSWAWREIQAQYITKLYSWQSNLEVKVSKVFCWRVRECV